MKSKIKVIFPFALLIVVILILYFTNLHQTLSFEWIYKKQKILISLAKQHPFLFPLSYVGIYVLSVCLIIPDATILTLIGGMIFPYPLAVFYAVLSETVGALIFFSIFKALFNYFSLKKERNFLRKMRSEFESYSAGYLLFLRLSHLFPFWLINLGAAYFRVNLLTFLWACFIGVLPLTFILVEAGHSLIKLFKEKKDNIVLPDIFTLQIKIALVCLGLLALLPILYKKIKGREKGK